MVRMSDTAYAVESFELLDDGEPEKQLTCEGWFHARVGVRGMQLAIPDQPLMIEDWRRPSPGLISMFGETGRNCRFKLQTRVAAAIEPKLPGTRLLVLLENNDGMTIDVSQSLKLAKVVAPQVFSEADQALVMRFEGLGDNCEFGLMQRQVGRERLSLLRYAGSRETHRLIEAVQQDFVGFGTAEDLWISTFHGEWIATSQRYGFNFHTGEHVDAMTEAQIREAESTKLTFMAGKLVEDLESCSKVFVRRVADDQPEAGMGELYDALRAKGPATLLWVVPATDAAPHGTVEHIRGRLFRGYHGAFAPYSTAIDYDSASWIALLRAAEAVIARHDPEGEALVATAAAAMPPELVAPGLVAPGLVAPGPAAPGSADALEPARANEAPPTETDTASWRVLTGATETLPGAPAPDVEPAPPPPDDGGFLGRLFGRKRQDGV